MENPVLLDEEKELGHLSLDDEARNQLEQAGIWAKRFGMLFYIVLSFQGLIVFMSFLSTFQYIHSHPLVIVVTLISFTFLLFQLFINKKLINFGNDIQYAIENKSEISIGESFRELKMYFNYTMLIFILSILINYFQKYFY